MEKRYVAGQAIDKEALLDWLQKGEVDELWVTFDNPFNYTRSTSGLDYVYLIWYNKETAQKHWDKISNRVVEIFDPDFASDEDEIVASSNVMASYKLSREEMFVRAKGCNETVTQIYEKGVGLIG